MRGFLLTFKQTHHPERERERERERSIVPDPSLNDYRWLNREGCWCFPRSSQEHSNHDRPVVLEVVPSGVSRHREDSTQEQSSWSEHQSRHLEQQSRQSWFVAPRLQHTHHSSLTIWHRSIDRDLQVKMSPMARDPPRPPSPPSTALKPWLRRCWPMPLMAPCTSERNPLKMAPKSTEARPNDIHT